MRLGPVALKLRAQETRFGNRVYGAAELAVAVRYTLNAETAFVIPIADTVIRQNDNDTWVDETIREIFGVIVALRNDLSNNEKMGITAYDSVEACRTDICAALVGWFLHEPDADNVWPITYQGGKVMDLNDAWLWYEFDFGFDRCIESKQPNPEITDLNSFYTQWIFEYQKRRQLPIPPDPITGQVELPETLIAPNFFDLILRESQIVYDGNGAYGGYVPVDGKLYKNGDQATILPNTNLSMPGMTFGGWNTKMDGTGTTYNPNQKLTIADDNVTLYAIWNGGE